MATRWPGLQTELGVHVDWRLAFVPPGTVVSPSQGTAFLDVGGHWGPGIIDHHQGATKRCSAARLVFERPEFVFDHLAAAAVAGRPASSGTKESRLSLRLVLHSEPDLDAMLCACLSMRLVENGEFPPWARQAVEYADRVDQGFERLARAADGYALYPLILMVMNAEPGQLAEHAAACLGRACTDRHELRARLGIGLILRAFDRTSWPAADGWDRLVDALSRWLDEDRGRYDALVAESGRPGASLRSLGPIRLPIDRGDGSVAVSASAMVELHPSACGKLYLRTFGTGEGPTPLTIIRAGLGGAADDASVPRRRFVISIDPLVTIDGRRPTLRGLGAALEELERDVREALGEPFRSERTGPTRFPEFPNLKDPWYDGRAHGLTIVDAPIVGSVLSFEQVESVVRSSFWEPPVQARCIGRIGDGEFARASLDPPTRLRLDGLLREVESARTAGRGASSFLVVVAEVGERWGDEPIRRLVRAVTGESAPPVDFVSGRAFVGRRGLLVLPPGSGAAFGVEEVFRGLEGPFRLIAGLEADLDDLVRSVSGDPAGASRCRGALRRYVERTAAYRTGVVSGCGPDLASLVRLVEESTGLERRIAVVGTLLDHLSEDSQRSLAAQLNRIVLLVGLFGVLQTLSQVSGGWEGPEWFASTLVAASVALGLLGVLSLSGRVLRFAKGAMMRFRLTAGFAEMILDDVDTDDARADGRPRASSASDRDSPGEPPVDELPSRARSVPAGTTSRHA